MTEIVAEAGIAHEGSLDTAKRLVDVAKMSGCKVIKFQTFVPSKLLREPDPELEKLALSYKDFVKLARHCESQEIEFMSTPGDVDSLKFLVEECGVKRIKIGSDDLTYVPLVQAAYKTKLPVILSTGMATLEEVFEALPESWGEPGVEAYHGPTHRITILHCVSAYPCPRKEINLKAMDVLKGFGYPVGYSDHTNHIAACLAAISREAAVVEKHFALDGYDGPDAEVSVGPGMLKALVVAAETIVEMLGVEEKEPTSIEIENRSKFRKAADGKRGFLQ